MNLKGIESFPAKSQEERHKTSGSAQFHHKIIEAPTTNYGFKRFEKKGLLRFCNELFIIPPKSTKP